MQFLCLYILLLSKFNEVKNCLPEYLQVELKTGNLHFLYTHKYIISSHAHELNMYISMYYSVYTHIFWKYSD